MIESTQLPADLQAALAAASDRISPFASRVIYHSQTGSTNDAAARAAALGAPDGTLVLAESQTAGRGRLGRAWFSPPGAGLYASVLLRVGTSNTGDTRDTGNRKVDSPRGLRVPRGEIPLLTIAGGVALAEGLRAATGLDVELKWPNDLMSPGGRRKLGGILAEGSAAGDALECVILGFGVNLAGAAYPPAFADRATAVEVELGRPVDRGVVLVECLAALAARRRDLEQGCAADVRARWHALAPSARGRPVEWRADAGARRGIAEGIDESGALLVRVGGSLERIVSGEVRWL
jgi:BirA family biotin operon repressor/biotin-[acetyl-CoA-carboxylase] ligase